MKRDKITEGTVEILDRFRHPGFSAYQGQPIEPHDTVGREKLAVYVLHPPVARARIDYQPGAGMAFYSDQASTMDETNSVCLDPLESLAALTDPIPDKGRHWVRTYGGYSNKKRGMRKKKSLRPTLEPATEACCEEVVDPPASSGARTAAGPAPDCSLDDDFRKECRRTWARMIKKIYEVDPLVCVRCGFPMRVLSVIEDPPMVRRILDHLGLWEAHQRPPPAIEAIASLGNVLPWVAEDLYPYDRAAGDFDDPA